jgi:hypothetical protein
VEEEETHADPLNRCSSIVMIRNVSLRRLIPSRWPIAELGVAAVGFGAVACMLALTSPHADISPTRLRLYVTKECRWSQEAIDAVQQQGLDDEVVVIPLEAQAPWSQQSCSRAFSQIRPELGPLTRLWLAVVPTELACGQLIEAANGWVERENGEVASPAWARGDRLLAVGFTAEALRSAGLDEGPAAHLPRSDH